MVYRDSCVKADKKADKRPAKGHLAPSPVRSIVLKTEPVGEQAYTDTYLIPSNAWAFIQWISK